MHLRSGLLLALLLGAAHTIPSQADILYHVTDLGTLPGGNDSYGTGINNAGQITGSATTASAQHAFLYSNGVMTDLGALGGNLSEAYGINDAGQVTGRTAGASGAGSYAFLYSNGVMTYLSTPRGENSSEGFGINNAGQITGYYLTASGFVHVFLYSNGVMTDIGSGYGYAINNAGQICRSRKFRCD